MSKNTLKLVGGLPILSTIGERIAWARKRKGLSQAALGGLVGKDQTAISQMERNLISSPRNIIDLADHLEVSPAWLQFGVEEIDNLDTRAIQFALKFNSLRDSDKETLEVLLSQISK